jgi:hypothetical protein
MLRPPTLSLLAPPSLHPKLPLIERDHLPAPRAIITIDPPQAIATRTRPPSSTRLVLHRRCVIVVVRARCTADSPMFDCQFLITCFSYKVWILYGPSNSAWRCYQHSKFIFTPTWEVCEEPRRRYVIVLFMHTYSLYSFNQYIVCFLIVLLMPRNKRIRNNKKELSSILTKIRLTSLLTQAPLFRSRMMNQEGGDWFGHCFAVQIGSQVPPTPKFFHPNFYPSDPLYPPGRVPHVNGVHVIAFELCACNHAGH